MYTEKILNSFENLNVRIYYHTAYNGKNLSPLHCHREFEFLYVPTGAINCLAGSNSIDIHAGEVLFLNSYVPHETNSISDDTSCVLIQFDENDFVANIESKTLKHLSRFFKLDTNETALITEKSPQHKLLVSNILAIFDEYKAQNSSMETFIKGYVYIILGILYRSGIVQSTKGIYESEMLLKIMPALIYIEENYNKKLTLDEVSRIAGLSSTYFCKIIKSVLGATLIEYINFVRVCVAEHALFSTSQSVIEVAYGCGFPSVSYFNKVFKSIVGCTPSQYKKIKHRKI